MLQKGEEYHIISAFTGNLKLPLSRKAEPSFWQLLGRVTANNIYFCAFVALHLLRANEPGVPF